GFAFIDLAEAGPLWPRIQSVALNARAIHYSKIQGLGRPGKFRFPPALAAPLTNQKILNQHLYQRSYRYDESYSFTRYFFIHNSDGQHWKIRGTESIASFFSPAEVSEL